jgi:hypothetical protein
MPPFVGGVSLSPLLIEENLLYSHRRKKKLMQKFKITACIPASYYEEFYVEANSIEEAYAMLPMNYEDRLTEPKDVDLSSLTLHRIDTEYDAKPVEE